MEHVSRQALNKIKSILELGLPAEFIGNIWRRRLHQLHDRDLPAFLIQYDNESVAETQAARASRPIQTRNLGFSIVVADKVFDEVERGKEGEALEDKMFALCALVEFIILDQANENDEIQKIVLNGIDIDDSPEGDRPLGFARLSFTMTLRTRAGEPQTFI